MLNDFIDYNIGEHFLSAIINNDYSGLDDSEEAQLRAFLDSVYSNPAIVNSAWDWAENDLDYTRCDVCDMHANCMKVKLWFHVSSLVVRPSGDEENLLY